MICILPPLQYSSLSLQSSEEVQQRQLGGQRRNSHSNSSQRQLLQSSPLFCSLQQNPRRQAGGERRRAAACQCFSPVIIISFNREGEWYQIVWKRNNIYFRALYILPSKTSLSVTHKEMDESVTKWPQTVILPFLVLIDLLTLYSRNLNGGFCTV